MGADGRWVRWMCVIKVMKSETGSSGGRGEEWAEQESWRESDRKEPKWRMEMFIWNEVVVEASRCASLRLGRYSCPEHLAYWTCLHAVNLYSWKCSEAFVLKYLAKGYIGTTPPEGWTHFPLRTPFTNHYTTMFMRFGQSILFLLRLTVYTEQTLVKVQKCKSLPSSSS